MRGFIKFPLLIFEASVKERGLIAWFLSFQKMAPGEMDALYE
jgi:hypothetical protein